MLGKENEPTVCITADAHIGTFMMDWSEYLDPEFREEYQTRRNMLMKFAEPGKTPDLSKLLEAANPGADTFNLIAEILNPEAVARQHADRAAFLMKHFGSAGDLGLLTTGGEGDPRQQLRELEADGTVGGICLPQTGPFTFGKLTPAQAKANGDAIIRWVTDFVSVAPDRHAGSFNVSLEAGMDVAVEQVKTAHKKGLRGGVVLDTNPELKGLPLYSARFWDPLWAVCADLGVVVNVHAGAGQTVPRAGGEILWMLDVRWFTARPLRYFLIGGVFERHPKLKVIFIETNASWAVEELSLLDAICSGDLKQIEAQTRRFFHYQGMADARSQDYNMVLLKRTKAMLKKKPSEYFQSNVWLSITCSEDDWAARDKLGVDRLLWGSDYPHNEASWPHSMAEVKKNIDKLNIPAAETRKIMGENAAKLWGFDMEKLRPAAQKIGPVFYS